MRSSSVKRQAVYWRAVGSRIHRRVCELLQPGKPEKRERGERERERERLLDRVRESDGYKIFPEIS